MSTATERPNKVEIIDAGPCRKKIKIEIPAETVEENLGSTLDTLLLQAELPGFRPGRAPKRLVEKKFGASIRKQAKEELVGAAFNKAVTDNKLKLVGSPLAEDLAKVEPEAGKPLIFEVDIEVVPEFTLPAIEGLDIKKPLLDVTEEMVTKEVDKICLTEGSLEEKAAPGAGDYVTGHARLTNAADTSKVFFESDGIVVQLPTTDSNGKGMIVGLMVDDLAKQMGTVKLGDKCTVKTKGPENHENEALRGVDLVIEYTPSRADAIIPAKLDDLAAKVGFPNGDAFKDAVRNRLKQRVAVDQQSAMRGQVMKHLIEGTEMGLPERLTSEQAGRNLQRHRMELMYRGFGPMQVEERIAQLRRQSSAEAIVSLKSLFIIESASEKLGVKVTEAEVGGRISQMAYERGMRPEALRDELIKGNQVSTLFLQIREHKTLDAIIAKSKVTEIPAEDFNKLMTESNKAAS